MIILPAIDIRGGQCVRLVKGEFSTASKVADSPVETAKSFETAGAEWIHMVDLDGALDGKLVNAPIYLDIAKNTTLKTEVGGGIRDMKAVEYYLSNGITRVILGSAAAENPDFVKEAVSKYGERIAVGIDARNGKIATRGWVDTLDVDYIEFAKLMEAAGVKTIIFTDISKDGTLEGPSLEQLEAINSAVSCDIVASGGICNIGDIEALLRRGLYGAICGKSVYSGTLDLKDAVRRAKNYASFDKGFDFTSLFVKSDLIPAIVQDESGDVLMLAYMNEESFRKTLETGYTWFYSRSRHELWNKGATSGHLQKVLSICSDCDNDTLLIKAKQTGNACHTGSYSCFYTQIY